jgi:hypothetical protein
MGGERSSTIRMREAGKICGICRRAFPEPHTRGAKRCSACQLKTDRVYMALVQIAEFGRVHWSFEELRTSDEQAEQHRRVVCRAALCEFRTSANMDRYLGSASHSQNVGPDVPLPSIWPHDAIPGHMDKPVSIACSSICRLSESPHASPRRANSLIFSGSANVNFLGRGVFRSASRNWTCHPDRRKKLMYTRWLGRS